MADGDVVMSRIDACIKMYRRSEKEEVSFKFKFEFWESNEESSQQREREREKNFCDRHYYE